MAAGQLHIKNLLPWHFQLMEMYLAGHNQTVIAQAVGKSRDMVNTVTRSPLFQAEVKRRREQKMEENTTLLTLDREASVGKARSILDAAAEKAAEVQEGLLESVDDSIKLRASNSILDRVLGKQDNSSPVMNVSGEHVQLLVLAMQESGNVTNTKFPADSPPAEAADDQYIDV